MNICNEHKDDNDALEGEATAPEQQIILGHIKGFDHQQRPVVTFIIAGQAHSYSALTTTHIARDSLNRQVALSFIDGRISLPLVLGLVYSPLFEYLDNLELSSLSHGEAVESETLNEQPVLVDGKKITIEGRESVELRCGDASITLTKSGKIVIRGNYILNRASGVNRIVGGSVQVN